jgi:Flp pilus assembly protein TadB
MWRTERPAFGFSEKHKRNMHKLSSSLTQHIQPSNNTMTQHNRHTASLNHPAQTSTARAAGLKKPILAFILNVLLPGAGLAYLGKWLWALYNLAGVATVNILAGLVLPESWGIPFSVGLGMGCGVMAQQIAMKMNKELSSQAMA